MHIPGFEHFEQTGESPVATFWQAFQTDLNRPVDIAIIKPQAIIDPAVRAEFLLNIRAAAGVKHSAIAQIFDIREMGTTLAVIQERLIGFSVRQWMRQRGFLKEEKALTIGRWVAEGLSFLHAKTGFSHLALTPDFIWLEPTGQVKLGGFGHHVLFEKLGRPPSDLGLLAPEQVIHDGPPCSFRTDIYALGALLYLMVTGRVPFEDRPAEERPALILSGQVSAPQVLRRGETTQAFNQLLTRMMAKDPEERYNSWQALMQEMDRILDGAKYLIVTRRPPVSTIQLPPNGPVRRAISPTASPPRSPPRSAPESSSVWIWAGLGAATAVATLAAILFVRLLNLPPPLDTAAFRPTDSTAAFPVHSPIAESGEQSPSTAEPVEAVASTPEPPPPPMPAETETQTPPPSPQPPAEKEEGDVGTFSLEALMDEVARRLLRGETQTAIVALDLAWRDPQAVRHRETIEELRRLVRRAADPLGLVLAELNRRQGRRVRITLAGQSRELTIQKVEDRRVTFMEETRAEGAVVHRPLIVDVGQLSPAALAGLLEVGSGPEFALARLILWHRAGQPEETRALVAETGLLKGAIARHLGGTAR